MMISELIEVIRGEILGNYYNPKVVIKGAYACDMLSRVVSTIENDQTWVTIMNSINVVAVASLSECKCVILAENVIMESDVLLRADDNCITIISSPFSTYEICGLIYNHREVMNEDIQM